MNALKQIAPYIATLLLSLPSFGQTFSIKNLKEVPKEELYVLSATSTRYGILPVVIRYNNDGTTWSVTGRMKIKDKQIDEEYKIKLSNLLITDSKRVIKYKRGTVTNISILDVNIATTDPNEYLVSTIPALMYVLRTFPFEENSKSVNVRAPSQEKGRLNLRVKNKGLKNMKTKNWGELEVWHLEVSVKVPVIGGFLPELDIYFKNDPQKSLVRIKGMMPGTGNKVDIELTKYEKK